MQSSLGTINGTVEEVLNSLGSMKKCVTDLEDYYGGEKDSKVEVDKFCKCTKASVADRKAQFISKEKEYKETGDKLISDFTQMSSFYAELDTIKNSLPKEHQQKFEAISNACNAGKILELKSCGGKVDSNVLGKLFKDNLFSKEDNYFGFSKSTPNFDNFKKKIKERARAYSGNRLSNTEKIRSCVPADITINLNKALLTKEFSKEADLKAADYIATIDGTALNKILIDENIKNRIDQIAVSSGNIANMFKDEKFFSAVSSKVKGMCSDISKKFEDVICNDSVEKSNYKPDHLALGDFPYEFEDNDPKYLVQANSFCIDDKKSLNKLWGNSGKRPSEELRAKQSNISFISKDINSFNEDFPDKNICNDICEPGSETIKDGVKYYASSGCKLKKKTNPTLEECKKADYIERRDRLVCTILRGNESLDKKEEIETKVEQLRIARDEGRLTDKEKKEIEDLGLDLDTSSNSMFETFLGDSPKEKPPVQVSKVLDAPTGSSQTSKTPSTPSSTNDFGADQTSTPEVTSNNPTTSKEAGTSLVRSNNSAISLSDGGTRTPASTPVSISGAKSSNYSRDGELSGPSILDELKALKAERAKSNAELSNLTSALREKEKRDRDRRGTRRQRALDDYKAYRDSYNEHPVGPKPEPFSEYLSNYDAYETAGGTLPSEYTEQARPTDLAGGESERILSDFDNMDEYGRMPGQKGYAGPKGKASRGPAGKSDVAPIAKFFAGNIGTDGVYKSPDSMIPKIPVPDGLKEINLQSFLADKDEIARGQDFIIYESDSLGNRIEVLVRAKFENNKFKGYEIKSTKSNRALVNKLRANNGLSIVFSS